MSRPKGRKNKIVEGPVTDSETETVSTYEAAKRLNTNETTIKLWADHGHLKRHAGGILVRSIRECRLNTRRLT